MNINLILMKVFCSSFYSLNIFLNLLFISKITIKKSVIYFIFISGINRIADEKKNAGNDHYKAQNYTEALRLYSDAITLCPESAAYYGNRAACLIMLGDYKGALSDSRRAIELDEKFEKGYVRAAKCCLSLGDIVGAEVMVKKWAEIDPKSVVLKGTEQQCKQLRLLREKAFQCYEKGDYRTAG